MSIERQLKLRYFKYLHDYVTQLQCYFFLNLSTAIEHELQKVQCIHI